MIQRIQTLYLLAATILMVMTLIFPIATFYVNGEEYLLNAFNMTGPVGSESHIWMGIILVLSIVVPFVTIFLFKYRVLQIRLCAVEAVLLLGAIVFVAIHYFGMDAQDKHLGWAAIMPVLALIPDLMAARAIFKDEVMVRSLDRIR